MLEFVIGARVKGGPGLRQPFRDQLGTILNIRGPYFDIKFDRSVDGKIEWTIPSNELGYGETIIPISPEEEAQWQDQQRRYEHAMKYL